MEGRRPRSGPHQGRRAAVSADPATGGRRRRLDARAGRNLLGNRAEAEHDGGDVKTHFPGLNLTALGAPHARSACGGRLALRPAAPPSARRRARVPRCGPRATQTRPIGIARWPSGPRLRLRLAAGLESGAGPAQRDTPNRSPAGLQARGSAFGSPPGSSPARAPRTRDTPNPHRPLALRPAAPPSARRRARSGAGTATRDTNDTRSPADSQIKPMNLEQRDDRLRLRCLVIKGRPTRTSIRCSLLGPIRSRRYDTADCASCPRRRSARVAPPGASRPAHIGNWACPRPAPLGQGAEDHVLGQARELLALVNVRRLTHGDA